MPHSGKTSKGPNYRSTPAHPNPAARGSRATGTTKSAAGRARRPAAPTMPMMPNAKASPKAMERAMGKQGMAMRSTKAKGRGRA